ncbi:uncharacterized protein 1700028J19Rikl isoform X10 [Rattus norvegicus]|uniref:uncharacterized protein 1700028J19Rikl isoform X10 n=1 Tax=Rattus norvegicus TaxID=10116 RepID=UPI0004E486F2|nr:uncharacterized protein LOC102552731 isoform X17 [Rattus norvegicus]
MASDCTISLPDLLCSWEEDRKLVLRGWSLVFIFLATLLVFSVVDGRMAYVHGPYTGFIGLWIDCRRHKCANVGQFTVCRRLNKIDFIFSFLSIGIGLLILLSLTLFAIDCNRLRPRPQQLSISARNLEPAQKLSTASNFVNYLEPPQQRDDATSQDTDESPQPDASTSVPVAQFPSDLP